MSDNVEKVLQDIVDDVVSHAIGICNQAVIRAADKAEKEMFFVSNRLLNAYYESYNPKIYKRTYQLKKAIIPFKRVHPSNVHISAIIGVEFDLSVLRYHAHVNHGLPIDEGWVFGQFLWGKHPNYLPERGHDGPNYIDVMRSLQGKIVNRFGNEIQRELIKIFVSKF